jgi:tetratricopeptide (TPR) repeat protein
MKTKENLTEEQLKAFHQAVTALDERKHDLVVYRIGNLVLQEPEFLNARALLRKAQIAKHKMAKSGLSNLLLKITKTKAQKALAKNDPHTALNEAEKALASDPLSEIHNKDLWAAAHMIAESAKENNDEEKAATFQAVACFALQTIMLNPKNVKAPHEFGNYLMMLEKYKEAQEVFEHIFAKDDKDFVARDRMKQCAARASMQRTNLVEASFNDMVNARRMIGEKVI